MKYLICSDIHGSAASLEKLLARYKEKQCTNLVLLGDILYHGPRNQLPEGYNPQQVVQLLNPMAADIFSCRGNCEAEVDQMLLNFPVMSDYTYIIDNNIRLFCTHGHIYTPDTLEKTLLPAGSVFFSGHTHIQQLYKNTTGILVCNPGSISLPKSNSPAGFAIYENRTVTLYDLTGKELSSLSV